LTLLTKVSIIVLLAVPRSGFGTDFSVTNTADAGPGSLRQAINDANSTVGPDTIRFNIPGAGLQTISPLSPLSNITDQVTIEGYSQPGASVNRLIQIN